MTWEDSKYLKEQIISEARSVAHTDDFKWGMEEFRDLQQRWKDAGWAGPDDDPYLWDEFSGLKDDFHSRRIADRDRRQAERDEGRRGKEQCISRARSLARSTDWKETAAELKQLREEFFEYNAGRDDNQQLKQQFDAEVQVWLNDLSEQDAYQAELFSAEDSPETQKLMLAIDKMNKRFGQNTVQNATCGIQPTWTMRSEQRSPNYTTHWQDVIPVKV